MSSYNSNEGSHHQPRKRLNPTTTTTTRTTRHRHAHLQPHTKVLSRTTHHQSRASSEPPLLFPHPRPPHEDSHRHRRTVTTHLKPQRTKILSPLPRTQSDDQQQIQSQSTLARPETLYNRKQQTSPVVTKAAAISAPVAAQLRLKLYRQILKKHEILQFRLPDRRSILSRTLQ